MIANCRLTLQVGDVFAARISEPKSHKFLLTGFWVRRAAKMWVEAGVGARA